MTYPLIWIIMLAVYMIGSMLLTWALRLNVRTQEDAHVLPRSMQRRGHSG